MSAKTRKRNARSGNRDASFRKTRWIVAALAATLVVVLIGFAVRGTAKRDCNVLLITLDTTRADRLSCYGYDAHRTAALDDIARSGLRFEWAFCTVPLTLPSHATILTGLQPPEHGCRLNGKRRLPDNVPILSQIFREHGYQTAAFIASFVLADRFGLDRGFDLYDDGDLPTIDDVYDDHNVYQYRRADVMTGLTLHWLKETRDSKRPFFCWLHYYDPHRPYHTKTDRYNSEVRFMDRQIGRLLAYLEESRLRKNTLIVVVGDHGEGLGDHGEDEHGILLINSITRVPLLFSLPGKVARGAVAGTPVSLVDLLPTILDFMGWEIPTGVSGKSLVPALRKREVPARPLYIETQWPFEEFGWAPLSAIVSNRWKYVRAPRPELYDIVADPPENQNLIESHKILAEDLRSELADMTDRMVVRAGAAVKMDARAEAILRSLGYAGGNQAPDGTVPPLDSLRDPKDMTDVKRGFMQVVGCEHREEFVKAERILRDLVKRSPESFALHEHLAAALYRQGKWNEARKKYEEVQKTFPGRYKTHYGLGTVLIRLGDYDRAIKELEQAIKIDPTRVRCFNNLAAALLQTGRPKDAARILITALKIKDNQADVHNNLGTALLRLKAPAKAEQAFRRAIGIEPRFADAHFNLGLALLEQKRLKDAAASFRRTLEIKPDHSKARDKFRAIQARLKVAATP